MATRTTRGNCSHSSERNNKTFLKKTGGRGSERGEERECEREREKGGVRELQQEQRKKRKTRDEAMRGAGAGKKRRGKLG